MRKRTNCRIYPLLIIGVFFVYAFSCDKDDDNNPSSGDLTNGKTTAVFNPAVTYGTMTDQDGNVYKTVTIGTQTWMAENLRTTKYRDGSAIPLVTGGTAWESLTTGAYCNYNNTANTETISTFGRLYNWYAVSDSRNIAPEGWHVPKDDEWTTLIDNLGDSTLVGGKLKETGTTHWNSPNTGATNETGFTALPGGYRSKFGGTFNSIGLYGDWWSVTEGDASNAWYRDFGYCSGGVGRDRQDKEGGFSVRCVRD